MAQLTTEKNSMNGTICESQVHRARMVTSFPTLDYELDWKIQNFSRLPLGVNVDSNDFCQFGGHFSILKSKYDLVLSFATSLGSTITIKGDISVLDIMLKEWSRASVQLTHKQNSTKVITYMNNNIKCFNRLPCDVLIFKFRMQITEHCPVTETYHFPNIELNGLKKLSSDMEILFREPVKPDVELRVNGTVVHAHWCILCARSSYFRRLFDSGMKQNYVDIVDLELNVLKRLVEFLYSGVYEPPEQDVDTVKLYRAADIYEVLALKTICGKILLAKVTEVSATRLLKLAEIHKDSNLKSQVMEFIRLKWNSDSSAENCKSLVSSQTTLLAEVELVNQGIKNL